MTDDHGAPLRTNFYTGLMVTLFEDGHVRIADGDGNTLLEMDRQRLREYVANLATILATLDEQDAQLTAQSQLVAARS